MAALIIALSFVPIQSWQSVGIYAGCPTANRFLYPLFHANLLHAALNSWCMLSVVFIYHTSIYRHAAAYLVAASTPVHTLSLLFPSMLVPTVGYSGVVFALFGSISFEVQRKVYYQLWMIFYLATGFLFPNTNACLHLYCYLAGLVIALFVKPIKIAHNE